MAESGPPSTLACPLHGACLCGAIEVRIARLAGPLVYCHCRQCRKTAGAPFLAVIPVAAAAFELRDPLAMLREYRATPHKARCFCGRCGAPVYSRRDGDDRVRVRAGLLDLGAGVSHGGHIYCADAGPWPIDDDGLPRYAAVEPGRRPAAPATGAE